jgi:hypothetical protein
MFERSEFKKFPGGRAKRNARRFSSGRIFGATFLGEKKVAGVWGGTPSEKMTLRHCSVARKSRKVRANREKSALFC